MTNSNQVPVTYRELKQKTFIEPLYLLYPWIQEGTLSMIHSWRGVGKTFFMLGLVQAIASASAFLKWATNLFPVFILDCEMGERQMRNRLNLMDAAGTHRMVDNLVSIFTYEHMGGFSWNLADVKNQKLINERIGQAKLIVIDNLSAFVRPIGREAFQQAYFRFRDWLLALAATGRSVLILHHSGKEGKQRGISDIEDPLDIVVHLRRPEGWRPQDGTIFEFHFEKTRGIDPQDPTVFEPISIELASMGNGVQWRYSPVEVKQKEFRDRRTEELKDWNLENDNW